MRKSRAWEVTVPQQWIEISRSALRSNILFLRSLLGENTLFTMVVKANAYGHGVREIVRIAEPLVDWFAVHSLEEASELKAIGVTKNILVLGYIPPEDLKEADPNLHVIAPSVEWLLAAAKSEIPPQKLPKLHLKLETGTNRQGIREEELRAAMRLVRSNRLPVVGAAMHFANIEDTLEHEFAREQAGRFEKMINRIKLELGSNSIIAHAACSAAVLLLKEVRYNMARVGIAAYGHWPSKETRIAWELKAGKSSGLLSPVLSWRSVVGQVKTVLAGETVGYGRTWRALRNSKIAVIPVGYSDGYSRILGNRARVLIKGKSAPVVGRVCMNILMADVTDIDGVSAGDVVTLIGKDGKEAVTAEELAELSGTINYEVLARLSPRITRRMVD